MNASPLDLNNDYVATYLQSFLREELHTSGFTEACVAVSGGLDSALVLKLAVEALGAEHVHPLFLPYKASSDESRRDAHAMFEYCGLPWQEYDISSMADPYLNAHPGIDHLRTGNVLARLRMIAIFDLSKEKNGLVLGTSNKSELLVGYSTWYGDMACALMPIGDLYKTQVRSLARFFDLPDSIIAKPPSADLWAGQTDEGEIGITYEMLDRILFLLVDQRQPAAQIVAAGYDANIVHRVERKIQASQFKRVAPPIAKISQRTVGVDFLYPRDWKK